MTDGIEDLRWKTPYSVRSEGYHTYVIKFEGDLVISFGDIGVARRINGLLNSAYNLGVMQQRIYSEIRKEPIPSTFPITIEMVGDGERVIVYDPKDIPSGVAFVVIETNSGAG